MINTKNQIFLIKKSKIGRYLLFLPPAIAWLIFSWHFLEAQEIDYLKKGQENTFAVYSDASLGGKTDVKAKFEGDTLLFKYELKEGYEWPYAGIFLMNSGKREPVNGKMKMVIGLKTSASKDVFITLYEFVPGYTKLPQNNFRNWEYKLIIDSNIQYYTIPLSDFELPYGWYKKADLKKEDLPEFDFNRIKNICIHNGTLINKGVPDEIKITRLVFKWDFNIWLLGLVIGSVSWLLGLFLIWLYKNRKNELQISYVATKIIDEPKNEWEQVQVFISRHYTEDLSMEFISKKLGIAKHKITSLIKENTSLIFKQYLNQIRVAEAKRLLAETDLPIGEIASHVGFGHISNFNRVFKELVGFPPSDIRK
jgi:AraC-like DNA-binding protein